jgi:CheY-specific phosphatase CheX
MSKQTIDVDLINAFWNAVKTAMQVMGGLKVKRRRVFIRPDTRMTGDFYAVIGLAQGMTGNIAVCFRREMARGVVEALFGEAVTDEALLIDGVGEICNLAAGGGKLELSKLGYSFEISPPTTLINVGGDLDVFNPAGTVVVIIECGISGFPEDQVFTIEVSLETEDRSEMVRRKHEQRMDGE